MTRAGVCSLFVALLAACAPDEARTLPPGTPVAAPSARPSPDPPPAIPPNVEDAGKADAADAAPREVDADAGALGF